MGLTIIECQGKTAKGHSVSNRAQLGQVVEAHLNIPQDVVNEAVDELRQLNDAWN